MRVLRAILLCSFLASSASFAQSVTGSMVGMVTDPTGQVVTGAEVYVQNVETGVTLTSKTNRSGEYLVNNLQPGTYRLHVNAPSFRAVDISSALLQQNQVLRNDVRLSLGEVAQATEVTSAVPVVQTETSSIATYIDSHTLTSMPTNGRTLDTFVLTAPGNTGEDSGSNPKIAGSQHWGGTSFTVNGVNYNDIGNGGGAYSYQTSLSTQPSLDTIEEVKIESNNASAEFSSSVAISMVTKGGTSKYHGTVFEFNRNTLGAANDWFANHNGLARAPYNRNEYGLTLGGPVPFADKQTFFFFSFEQWVNRTSRTGTFSVPTSDQRNGCFTSKIVDPITKIAYPHGTSTCPSGYQIPASALDPRTQEVLAFVPLPTKAGSTSNFVQNLPSRVNIRRYDFRIDHNFAAKDMLSLIGNYSGGGNPYSVNLYSPAAYNNYSNAGYATQSLALTYTHIFTPYMSNELRLSYFDHASVRQGQNLGFDPSSLISGLYPHAVGGLPTFSISGLTSIADRGGSSPNPEITQAAGDTFTYEHGRHQFKFGADAAISRVMTNPSTAASTLGFFYFGASRYTGVALANALVGTPNDAVRSTMTPPANISINRYGFYGQDAWRIFPQLTLDLGLRYELQTEPTEKFGTMANFDFTNGLNAIRSVNGNLPSTTNQTMLALYPYETSEQAGWGSDVLVPDHKNFAPRIGFAYRPFSNASTVLRGGYGIFYNMPPVYQGIYQLALSNPPFRLTQEYDSASTTPTVTLANPFAVTPYVTANPVLYAVDHRMHNTYSQQWNLTVEQRLPWDVGLRLSYLGNKAVHAPYVNYDMNMPQVQSPKAISLQAVRPYQPYSDIYALRFVGDSFTNQMQVQLTKIYAHSLYFTSSFNWTKGLDDVPETGSPQNPYNPHGDWGNADGVRPLAFYFSGGYDLPFGPGQRFLSKNNLVGKIAGGWSVTTIAQILSGAPVSVTFDPSSSCVVGTTGTCVAWYATRANYVPGTQLYPGAKTINGWFNSAAFAIPTPYTFGNSQRNMIFGPYQRGADVSLTKSIDFVSRMKLQLRVDAFNITNTVNFAQPTADLSIPSTFGTITATNVAIPARTLQFGAKLIF